MKVPLSIVLSLLGFAAYAVPGVDGGDSTSIELRSDTEHANDQRSMIAFDSDRDGNWEIYAMSADGSTQRRLTDNRAADRHASWSPDGSMLAFESDRDGSWEVYVMNKDGSGQRRLTFNTYDDNFPSWSPDGSRVAFSSDRDGHVEAYVMNLDGSNQRRITDSVINAKVPFWSPDGSRIIIESDTDPNLGGDVDICTILLGGTNLVRLTASSDANGFPSWSPDGTQVLFDWNRMSISVMDSDGTHQKTLSTPLYSVERQPAYEDRHARWSPDGTRIVFETNRHGNWDVYSMRSDGSDQTRLTNSPGDDRSRPGRRACDSCSAVVDANGRGLPTRSYGLSGTASISRAKAFRSPSAPARLPL